MKRLIREVLATHREDRVVRWVASAQTSSSNFPVHPLSETHARLLFHAADPLLLQACRASSRCAGVEGEAPPMRSQFASAGDGSMCVHFMQ